MRAEGLMAADVTGNQVASSHSSYIHEHSYRCSQCTLKCYNTATLNMIHPLFPQVRVTPSVCWSWITTDFRHTLFTRTSIQSGIKSSPCEWPAVFCFINTGLHRVKVRGVRVRVRVRVACYMLPGNPVFVHKPWNDIPAINAVNFLQSFVLTPVSFKGKFLDFQCKRHWTKVQKHKNCRNWLFFLLFVRVWKKYTWQHHWVKKEKEQVPHL